MTIWMMKLSWIWSNLQPKITKNATKNFEKTGCKLKKLVAKCQKLRNFEELKLPKMTIFRVCNQFFGCCNQFATNF